MATSPQFVGTILQRTHTSLSEDEKIWTGAARARFLQVKDGDTRHATAIMTECHQAMLDHLTRGSIQDFVEKWGSVNLAGNFWLEPKVTNDG